jgi:hypothetical protein
MPSQTLWTLPATKKQFFNFEKQNMPFTFSHPAAVLPLTYLPKKWFSLTGLVVGSLTPDFEYFIRMKVYSSFSHTWLGLFWFDLPLAFILALVFHQLVRDNLINNMPHFIKSRFIGCRNFRWIKYLKDNWVVVIISCVIGSATHILWDGFTHQQGYFVQTMSSLQNPLIISEHSIPIYKLLQHVSSFVGVLLIIYAIWKMPMQSISRSNMNWRYWLIAIFIALVVLSVRVLISDNIALSSLIISSITGGLLGLIFTPSVLSLRLLGK